MIECGKQKYHPTSSDVWYPYWKTDTFRLPCRPRKVDLCYWWTTGGHWWTTGGQGFSKNLELVSHQLICKDLITYADTWANISCFSRVFRDARASSLSISFSWWIHWWTWIWANDPDKQPLDEACSLKIFSQENFPVFGIHFSCAV